MYALVALVRATLSTVPPPPPAGASFDFAFEIPKEIYINEYVDETDDGPFYQESTIMFEDPFGKPYSYSVDYEKKMESGFYDDNVVGVTINSAKAYKLEVDDDSDGFLFDITNETDPSLSDIQDWVYNHEIGDSRLNLL